jgi:L-threonylcarbamoyladenylate synthase
LPGPVTLVLANPAHRYPLACREDAERLGVRLIEGPLAGAMCPLFHTSANVSGEPAASRFEDIPEQIVAAVDLAIDGGRLGGLPSTVVDIAAIDEGGAWTVLREGAVSRGDLAAALDHLA